MPYHFTCEVCGTVFERRQPFNHGSPFRYCSNSCSGKAKQKRIDCICLSCGKVFQVPPSALRDNGGRYCSHSCYVAHYFRPRPLDESQFWAKADFSNPDICWRWQGDTGLNGYGVFSWNGQRFAAHRLAYKLAWGTDPGDLLVCHFCDVRSCINPFHLFLGTHLDNMADMYAKGRQATGDRHGTHTQPQAWPRGSASYQSKLVEADILMIRQMDADGVSRREIAARFDISFSSISMIISRKIWKHVA